MSDERYLCCSLLHSTAARRRKTRLKSITFYEYISVSEQDSQHFFLSSIPSLTTICDVASVKLHMFTGNCKRIDNLIFPKKSKIIQSRKVYSWRLTFVTRNCNDITFMRHAKFFWFASTLTWKSDVISSKQESHRKTGKKISFRHHFLFVLFLCQTSDRRNFYSL